MIYKNKHCAYIICATTDLTEEEKSKAAWLLDAEPCSETELKGPFVGPRAEMVSAWSTNATEIFNSVGLKSVTRVEKFSLKTEHDPMLEVVYESLGPSSLVASRQREPVRDITDIEKFNEAEGLALSGEEIDFLNKFVEKRGSPLTDVELFGFSQINSEHCRHKIFNGTFVVDGVQLEESLFDHIRKTSKKAPAFLISAYKDNVAFVHGAHGSLFYPDSNRQFDLNNKTLAISIKAETHNFPTTVEPFYGASTGSGGEIRDRMAGGRGSIPLTGTAVYMTSYPDSKRNWRYQTPEQILIKASNGASDFGNKFGQPLITGSVFTYEMEPYAYDRAVMLAGGVGVGVLEHTTKSTPRKGDKLVLLGGDNYRIGLGGGAVSSVISGDVKKELELSAVQRANPEMQKRAYNAIRAFVEADINPVVSIHDHGAGGHLNCFSELLEETGGVIYADELPLGDESLSLKELLSNESQERMGLIFKSKDIPAVKEICERERCPVYVVGEVDCSGEIKVLSKRDDIELCLPNEVLFADPPKLTLVDNTAPVNKPREFTVPEVQEVLPALMKLESCSCKDWLTNKVDRSVTGLVALQQCAGPHHLPINDCAVTSADYLGSFGIASTQGHASGCVAHSAEASARLSVAEALTNICQAPIADGIRGVALSANWMWPAKQPGEGAKLYEAVKALGEFSSELGIAVPTGKDSLSMTMVYPDGSKVSAPGTVVVTAVARTSRVNNLVQSCFSDEPSTLFYVDFSGCKGAPLGGSAFEQTLGFLIDEPPSVSATAFRRAFELVQSFPDVLAYHDVSAGGALVALVEMSAVSGTGFEASLGGVQELLTEKPAAILQIPDDKSPLFERTAAGLGVEVKNIGSVYPGSDEVDIQGYKSSPAELLKMWTKRSSQFEALQSGEAVKRSRNIGSQPLRFNCKNVEAPAFNTGVVKAAILRAKGTNGDRELAYSLHRAGFEVRDISMQELSNLDDIQFLAFPGGFSNSDVLGAARGWAGVFKFNQKAKNVIESFYKRDDTLSIGVCNGCQLMGYLGVVGEGVRLEHNNSHKFESAFVSVKVEESPCIMLKPLVGAELGVWIAHGEGRFSFTGEPTVALKYSYSEYPGNPNGSELDAAGICSRDGRHLALMPHLERSILAWQWPNKVFTEGYTPWMRSFQEARAWFS